MTVAAHTLPMIACIETVTTRIVSTIACMDAVTVDIEATTSHTEDSISHTAHATARMKSTIKPPFESTATAHEKMAKLFFDKGDEVS